MITQPALDGTDLPSALKSPQCLHQDAWVPAVSTEFGLWVCLGSVCPGENTGDSPL